MIIVEVALKESSIGVQPFATNKLAVLEHTDVLHSSLLENVSTLSIFLSVLPLSRVNVTGLALGGVDHDSFTVSLSVKPVSVVASEAGIDLFSDSVLLIVSPGARVSVFGLLCSALGVSVESLSVSDL